MGIIMRKKLITKIMVIVIILTAMIPNTSYAKKAKNIKVSLRKGCTMTVTWRDNNGKAVYLKCKSAKSSNNKIAKVIVIKGKIKIKALKSGKAVVTVKTKDKNTYKYSVIVTKKKVSTHKHSYKWVKDSASWDEQVPICESVKHRVCCDCGYDFGPIGVSAGACPKCGCWDCTTKWVDEITGYDTIHHPELGHYKCKCGKTK